jgi:hypothetical protein
LIIGKAASISREDKLDSIRSYAKSLAEMDAPWAGVSALPKGMAQSLRSSKSAGFDGA